MIKKAQPLSTLSTTRLSPYPFNLSHHAIGKQAATSPNKTAIELIGTPLSGIEKTSWTYAELDTTLRSLAGGLINKGAVPGAFLLLRLESNALYVFCFFAAIAAGLIPIPLSPDLTDQEIDHFIKDTGARWMILGEKKPPPSDHSLNLINENELLAALDEGPPPIDYAATQSEDPAFLIYTSGSTNKPKGVLHAQRVIKGRTPMQQGWHDIQSTDRVLHAGAYNWTYSLGVGVMDPLSHGATALIYQGEKSSALWPTLIANAKPTIFAAVPGIYRQILKHANSEPQHFKSLRHCLSAGETLSPALKADWQAQTGTPIYEALGQSEISTYVSTAPHITVPKTAKGRVQPGRTVAILPEHRNEERKSTKGTEAPTPLPANEKGLIAIHQSDPGLLLSYWRDQKPEPIPTSGPWFLTGDYGALDEQQNLTHFGRADDLMNAFGYRVSPFEVETALMASGLLTECAVFEKQVREDLSIICAHIIPNQPNTSEKDVLDQLQAHLKATLAAYKHPRELKVVRGLPRNKAGKLDRQMLQNPSKS